MILNKLFAALLAITILLTGCGLAPKNVIAVDGKTASQIRCPGYGNAWSTCFEKANEFCPGGFNVVDREQFMIDNDFPVRILTYRCK